MDDYKTDKYYPKVVRAFEPLLTEGDVVSPIEVLITMGNLNRKKYEDWRFGRIPNLEKAIDGSPVRNNRILRLIGFHAHDLDMRPSPTAYKKWGKGNSIDLRFTKNNNVKIESIYSRCFVWNKRLPYLKWKDSQSGRSILL